MTAFCVIVPARMAATRLPNKPLADIGGVPMIVRTLRQAAASGAEVVAAACADTDVAAAVQEAGFTALMTGEHPSGSSRVAAAAAQLGLGDEAIVVNMQGDEPFMEPEVVAKTAELLALKKDCACATACRPARSEEEVNSPDVVKVVGNDNNEAVYFSRAGIPYRRSPAAADGSGTPPATAGGRTPPQGGGSDFGGIGLGGIMGVRVHLGLYAYYINELQEYISRPPAPTEQLEQLEQLRILWYGGRIALWECESESFGVDTEEDLARARERAQRE